MAFFGFYTCTKNAKNNKTQIAYNQQYTFDNKKDDRKY